MAQKPGVALITGASGGIGEALARLHAARGGDLVLVARSADKLEALKHELEAGQGISVTVLAEDLTDPAAPQRIHDRVKAEGIAIDILMNNAGFGGQGRFDQRDWAADRAMIEVNIVALSALTRLFLPDFVARGTGRVLNTSSSAALTPGPLQAVYYATKAYVTSFSNALAGELEGTGVTVTALMPGPVATGFAKASDLEKTQLFRKAATATDVARDGYEAMLKGELNVISGVPGAQRMVMRLMPFLPKRAILRMVRQMQEV